MKLDFDSLYSVSREEFQRDFDAILEIRACLTSFYLAGRITGRGSALFTSLETVRKLKRKSSGSMKRNRSNLPAR